MRGHYIQAVAIFSWVNALDSLIIIIITCMAIWIIFLQDSIVLLAICRIPFFLRLKPVFTSNYLKQFFLQQKELMTV